MKKLIEIAKRAYVTMELLNQAQAIMPHRDKRALDGAMVQVAGVTRTRHVTDLLSKRAADCKVFDGEIAKYDELVAALETMIDVFDDNPTRPVGERMDAVKCAQKALSNAKL